YDVTLIGDLEINTKQLLTKLDALDYVLELMNKENALHKQHQLNIPKSAPIARTNTGYDRLKAAETFLEQKRKFSTLNSHRQQVQFVTQPNTHAYNASTKLMIEKHNNALLFNRRRSKSALPVP
ncbi:unnamed protein product, partial [Rotaria magnacalcarata]